MAELGAPPRILVADDAPFFRELVAEVLRSRVPAEVRTFGDGSQLLAAAVSPPDLAIVDVRMPPTLTTEGLDTAAALRLRHPGVPVLVLSQFVARNHLDRLVPGGAGFGYVLKERVRSVEDFVWTVRRVMGGGTVIDREVVRAMAVDPARANPIGRLTTRESEVLALIAEGRSNRSISTILGTSQRTLETHIRSVFQKLDLPEPEGEDADGVNRRVLAVLAFVRANPAS
jgi:DNA-binding NarL/FixJ family response regulator